MSSHLLSVCLITYNHEKYIQQAIEGVLSQQTSFSWELIIADDCSTDGTREILERFKSLHPERITLLLQKQNVGALRNWLDLIGAARSKYIAYFEGDDFWTDPRKLQIQVDFLESNPDYAACFHDVSVVDSDGKVVRKSKSSRFNMRDFTSDELIKGRVMSTLSMCFRNVVTEFPEELKQAPLGDKFLCSLLGHYGHGKFLPQIKPSAYRIHAGGIWSQQSRLKKEMNLVKTYFWLWQYYERLEQKGYALFYFNMIIRHGFFSSPYDRPDATYFDKAEYWIVKTLRKVFAVLKRILKP